jgi:hypothetical protein
LVAPDSGAACFKVLPAAESGIALALPAKTLTNKRAAAAAINLRMFSSGKLFCCGGNAAKKGAVPGDLRGMCCD